MASLSASRRSICCASKRRESTFGSRTLKRDESTIPVPVSRFPFPVSRFPPLASPRHHIPPRHPLRRQHHLPQLDPPRAEARHRTCEVEAPHAAEAFVIALRQV